MADLLLSRRVLLKALLGSAVVLGHRAPLAALAQLRLMYFAGDRSLEADRIFRRVPPAERARVVVELEKAGPGVEPDARRCRFDITLPSSARG